MANEPLATITEYIESSECDLCSKEAELVVATFRSAFPPGSHVCFGCLKKLVLVDHKHQIRNGARSSQVTLPEKD